MCFCAFLWLKKTALFDAQIGFEQCGGECGGGDVTESLHRIKESTVKKEVEAAGFKLVAEGKDLTFPGDDGTKRVFENDVRGKTNQFMLKFQKPR